MIINDIMLLKPGVNSVIIKFYEIFKKFVCYEIFWIKKVFLYLKVQEVLIRLNRSLLD